ncbi:DUF1849 family protein [Thalassobaculum sp.]|uniref:EipB family protein n=1 Tax=Thalassobaculum sp. TaxID=2022740 RepID=UPI0032EB0787
MRVIRAIVSLATASLMAFPAIAAPSADGIVAHRALYKITLARATSASEIIDVRGRMGFEWRDECDGWAIEQRYLMSFAKASGDGYEISSSYTTWEAKAGNVYRFIVERERGGGSEQVKGRGVMPLPLGSGSGKAVFSDPEHKEFLLTADTLMPSEHTLRLIDEAKKGKKFFQATVFDGSEVEPGSLVSAVIGSPKSTPAAIDHPALAGSYWPVRLAFFKPGQTESAPDFEMSVDLLENGIARRMLLDYGDFRVAMTLERLEVIDRKGC